MFLKHQVLLDLWISPGLLNEDIALSKAAMFNLGFRLVTKTGKDIWDENGNDLQDLSEELADFEDEPSGIQEVEVKESLPIMLPLFLQRISVVEKPATSCLFTNTFTSEKTDKLQVYKPLPNCEICNISRTKEKQSQVDLLIPVIPGCGKV